MFNYHSKFYCNVRAVLRRLGVIRLLQKLGVGVSNRYEDRFGTALLSSVRRDDCVWDIGANVGFYTTKLSSLVGNHGSVVAFEPLPAAVHALRTAVEGLANVQVCQVAISDRCGVASFADSAPDAVSTTSHLSDESTGTGSECTVEVTTVDAIAEARQLRLPNVTKVDVEGYEEEVLRGGSAVFGSATSRELFIEVHFARLSERGAAAAPDRIVKMLSKWGYEVNWTDASHIHAFRSESNKTK